MFRRMSGPSGPHHQRSGLWPRHQGIACSLAAMILLATESLVAGNYIGVERCKTCHEFEYSRWAAGPHAQGHDSLTAKQLEDSKCNTCHTMDPGRLAPRFVGIQCERCHGGGKYYHLDHVMRDQELARAVGLVDVTEAHCRQCHTAGTPSIRPFDFATMWKRIDHGSAARAIWEAARAPAEGASP